MFYIYQNSYGSWDIAEKTNANAPKDLSLAVIRAPMFKTRLDAIAWCKEQGISI